MPDLFDTRQVPDTAMYWDAMAERVAAAARVPKRGAIGWVARSRASWVAASLLLAAAVLCLLLPTGPGAANRASREWTAALVPTDDLAKAIIRREGPPTLAVLLLEDGMRGSR